VARLAAVAGDHSTLVLTLAYCGLRWSEMSALRVRDIEFLKRRMTIARAVATVGSRQILGLPKGGKTRSVPVAAFVLDALSVQCQGKGPDDLVFPNPQGGFMARQRSVSGWFAGAVRRAGIQHVTPHDLRHTCASLTVSAGANVLALQRILGHSRASETLDTYSDLFDSDLDAVATIVDERYAASVPKMCPQGSKTGL
jgi:integrase